MRFEPDRVRLAAVDPAEPSRRISTAEDPADLVRSIARVGLIAPPVLLPVGDRFRIVAGSRRIAALRSLGWTETPIRRIPADTPPLDQIRLAIADNAFQRALNPVERSRALRALAEHFPDPGALAAEAGRLNLPDHPSPIRKLLPLAGLPETVRAALLAEAVTPSVALELASLPPTSRESLVALFLALGLSHSRQREFLALLDEIAAREDRTIPELLREPEIGALLDDPETDRPRKAGAVRRHLRRRRFPAIAAAEERYERIAAELPLGPGIRLDPPRDFEGAEFVATLRFGDAGKLEEQVRSLEKLIRNPEFSKLFEPGFP
jgi:ParB/RepB/Spo0J family partition protein